MLKQALEVCDYITKIKYTNSQAQKIPDKVLTLNLRRN